ncbi:hypothetical protein Trydic_g18064 [Trypoxylus dichotomus]
MKLLLAPLGIFGLISFINAARILCVFPHIAHSHYTIGSALVKGLASRGHHVTFMTPIEEKEPTKNVKSVLLKDVKKRFEELFSQQSIFDRVDMPATAMMIFMKLMMTTSTEVALSDQAVQEMINSNETFDLVITEYFFNDAFLGIADRFKAPSVLVTTIGPSIWSNYLTANPSIYSYMPHPFLGYGQRMTFWERIHNLLFATLENLFNAIYYFPQQEKILHKYLPDAPSLQELIRNTSLHIFNSDPSINGPFPISPNIIEIGGIHLTPPKKLPDDLQKYLDESKDGVIYFSLGGNLKSKDLPQETREAILRVLSKQKERILWKFEADLPGKPKNVEIRKWLPQQDILAHPNVKLFVTHGGLLSTTESLYHGVPVIGISVFGDQDLNMRNAENRGYGISLRYKEFTEEKFATALDRMLSNPMYSIKAKEISSLVKDKQVTQLDKAMYSIEYVIRHKGIPHLRSAAHDLNWFQYHSLDIHNMKLLLVVFSVFGFISFTNAARILCIFPHIAHSHYTIGSALVKGLATRGHHVTFMTPIEEKEPIKNVKSVLLNDVKKHSEEMFSQTSIFDMVNMPLPVMIIFMGYMMTTSTEVALSDQAVQAMINSNETFDLVITEYFFNDAFLGIADHFKAASVLVTTIGPSIWTNHLTANPSIHSYMPHPFLGYGQRMTFWERIHNVLFTTFENLFNAVYTFPQQEKILHKHFPKAPSLHELIRNTSLHIFNSDPSVNGPFPLSPNIIEIGGIHLTPPKKLPDDLQKYLDESKDGVIYFSLGGNLKSKDLPQETREAILRVLSKQKERILWKFEADLPGKPKNVEIRKWLPQQDILAHPNVKLFITHGGLLSTTESLYHGVPVIGISVFGDQDLNMRSAENRGYGISLPYKEFTEEKFATALDRMLNNPMYSKKVKEISSLMRDKQVTQLDKAVYSIEHVIRHKGTPHLRSAAHDLNWFQYHSLDVILFLVLIMIRNMRLLPVLVIVFALISVINAAKILCIFPVLAHSHYTIGSALVKGLAARGHHVTFVTPIGEKEPIKNVKSLVLNDVKKHFEEKFSQTTLFDMLDMPAIAVVMYMGFMMSTNTEVAFSDQVMQAIMNSNETFDLVITEYFFNDAFLGIANRFKAPSVLVTTFGPSIWSNYLTANPTIYSYMPHPFSGYGQRMTFWERTRNLLLATFENLFKAVYYFPQQEKILHKYFPDAPSLQELIRNTSLHIFNSDPSVNGPFPLSPNIIEIGGIHLTPPKKLPDDLQKYLDESKDGVIYFSLGGNLKSKDLPQEKREAILRVLSKQKERILWKFEADLPGKPRNVEIRKWLPQQDILAHPNVKLFITHGGLLSTTESLYHGVPIIGISVYGDQDLNMRSAENRGFGISLPYKKFTEEKFATALDKILNNPMYSKKARDISSLIRDKQVTPLDKATYSIEYVIRHKGTPHFRSAAHDLNCLQYYSLDVILFLVQTEKRQREEVVVEAMKTMKNKKVAGRGGIPVKPLKNSPIVTSEAIVRLFTSIQGIEVPEWKIVYARSIPRKAAK